MVVGKLLEVGNFGGLSNHAEVSPFDLWQQQPRTKLSRGRLQRVQSRMQSYAGSRLSRTLNTEHSVRKRSLPPASPLTLGLLSARISVLRGVRVVNEDQYGTGGSPHDEVS